MKYEIIMSHQAKIDLRNILEYIIFNFHSQINAHMLLNYLEKQIQSLEYMPNRFKIYAKEPWKSRGLHILSLHNYLIFYYVKEREKNVIISRILRSKQNTDYHLNKYS